jgi:hypothetical protein
MVINYILVCWLYQEKSGNPAPKREGGEKKSAFHSICPELFSFVFPLIFSEFVGPSFLFLGSAQTAETDT